MQKKIIILHDTFLYKWWGERLILMMGKILDADIASWFFSKGSFDLRYEGFQWKMIAVSSEIFKKGFRHLKLKWAFLFRTKFLRTYDIVVFSGDCISAVRNCRWETKKIYYCHTPPRYFYDLYDLYIGKVPVLLKAFFNFWFFLFRRLYERDIKKMDIILTNSINTQARIKKYLWLDSQVLYPPVDTGKFKYIDTKEYYLSFARLADAKRVDRVVEAFKKIPDKKLVVIYGENDPAREKIFISAKGFKNIEFITLKNNIWFEEYIGNAIATIYIPIDEDFGMSPIESMSAWKPVLWVNDGGLKETIIHKKTGYLISREANIDDIIAWVKYLDTKKSLAMREACEKRAEQFSLTQFEEKLKGIVCGE